MMIAVRARWQKKMGRVMMRRVCSCDVFPEKTLHQYSFDNKDPPIMHAQESKPAKCDDIMTMMAKGMVLNNASSSTLI
jgi:hypothetical protein